MRNPAAVSARAALVALSLVAAWSLARCFVGPGEVVPALAAAAAGDLTILGATVLARRSRALGALLAALGPLVVVVVPVWIVLGGATTWGWPTFATWHVVGVDLSHAWTTFNALRAPVPELPGFSLVGAWAVGGAALLAGWAADGGDTPLWVVAPPSAIFLFTSALGTPGWRPLAITAEVAALGWYAASARAARRLHTVGVAERPVPTGRQRARRSFGVAWPAASIVVMSALLGGLIGPRLPGALSPALVSLRNAGTGADFASGQVIEAPSGQIAINTLVQVAQSEIFQSNAVFFLMTTASPAYTILTTLDTFDGDRWTSSQQGTPLGEPLPYADTEIPQPQRIDGGQAAEVEYQLQVQQLGGQDVPAAAVPVRGLGPGTLTFDVQHETLTSAIGLDSNMIFDVVSQIPLLSPADAPASLGTLSPELLAATALPQGIPQQIVQLAHQLVAGETTDYEKAASLEQFFQSGSFKYSLPGAGSGASETVSGGEGLQDLAKFLFQTRTGFCQQFASAYAVLARIDGLPTRIAVGFTPGKQVSSGTYEVTGTDVHAWPQVYLGGVFGWWSFEPTPGSELPAAPFPPPAGHTSTGGGNGGPNGPGVNPKLHRPLHNITGGHQPGSGTTPVTLPPIHQLAAPPAGNGAGIAWLVFAGLLVVLFGAAPVTRFARRRRAGRGSGRVVTAWFEAASSLTLIGLYQHDGETHGELVRRVTKAGALPERACDQLARLADLTTVAVYAPRPPPPEAVRQAVLASREVCAAARRSVSPWRRGWAAIDPRQILRTVAPA